MFHIEKPENDVGLVWKKKEDERFLSARNGDSTFCPFQCDVCWFVNLKKELPNKTRLSHLRILGYIRRVNLDAMWSREGATVGSSLSGILKQKRIALELDLPMPGSPRGPWEVGDNWGMQTAIAILRQSQEPGRNSASYQQFDSVRRIRTATFNEAQVGVGAASTLTFVGERGNGLALCNGATHSLFFKMFMRGCEKRMGRFVMQDKALDIRILMEVLKNYRSELRSAESTPLRKRNIKLFSAYMGTSMSGALRGGEGFMMERSELVANLSKGATDKQPHVVMPLMGRFKSETGERNTMFILASTTASGIRNRELLEGVADVLVEEGLDSTPGPAYCDQKGKAVSYKEMNAEFHLALRKVQKERPDLIADDVDIEDVYNIYRSLRRGATSRATELGYDGAIIDMNNRWRKVQLSKGARPAFKMRELYVELKLVLPSLLRFSLNL